MNALVVLLVFAAVAEARLSRTALADRLVRSLPDFYKMEMGGDGRLTGLRSPILFERAHFFHPRYNGTLPDRGQCTHWKAPRGSRVSDCGGKLAGAFTDEHGTKWELAATSPRFSFAYRVADVPEELRRAKRSGKAYVNLEVPPGGGRALAPRGFQRAPLGEDHFSAGDPLFVELLVINDFALFQEFGAETEEQAAVIFNLVAGMYDTLAETDHPVHLVLRAQYTITTVEEQNGGVLPLGPLGTEVDSGAYLTAFRTAMNGIPVARDASILLSGREFTDGVLGLAYVGGACDSVYGAGVVSQAAGSDALDAVTMAHELGHLLGMCHDPPASRSGDTCAAAPSGCSGFVMSSTADVGATEQPDAFSPCSAADVNRFLVLDGGGTYESGCLEVPDDGLEDWFNTSVCGDSIVQRGEDCDPGHANRSVTGCCEGCRFTAGSTCESGRCCHSCSILSAGTVCRAAVDACDFAETCTGESATCPVDTGPVGCREGLTLVQKGIRYGVPLAALVVIGLFFVA